MEGLAPNTSRQQKPDLVQELRIGHASGPIFHCECEGEPFETFATAIGRPLFSLLGIRLSVVDPPTGLNERRIIFCNDRGAGRLQRVLYGTGGFFWTAGMERIVDAARQLCSTPHRIVFVIEEM